ncbi:Leucine-rich repeat LRR protein [Pyrenophora tritici-repentis]|uniref:Leucine rich repeat n=1 Tax=Pyrenophora tritici-repentis TaxID=45151 RepID=A0A2W1HFZ9_9PLEO|nr:Leucine-rich repeat protein [Pyrenophora tritici-repentis]KAF7443877.1 Leucine-rich repeat protein [Pyrenophora tritici-repentis]KAF7566396.1 Leucine-rich repeat (LRR) protein [Pyrenophora tritici-repentis]KAG9379615.1 Leucine-rich repeat protein [Pyrenophora tritici-repentis]KAI0586333.1 Leucine-rich repeat (LRR) protein [Pyrenophora tritici-repentis]
MESSPVSRPSGIPRPAPSRLPVLRPSGSVSQLRAPASTEQLRKKPSNSAISNISNDQPLRRKPSLQSISRPTASTLQKKTSRASLARSNTTASTASQPTSANSSSGRAPLASNPRRASGIPSFGHPRHSITSTISSTSSDASVIRRPFARPPSRQANEQSRPTSSSTPGEDDTLGSLNDFRSASRASSRASSRAGFNEDDPEADYAVKDDAISKDIARKKSRQSLSERTIESLSQLPSSPAPKKGRRRSSFFNADNSMPPPLRPASATSNGSRPSTSDGAPQAAPATPRRLGGPSNRLSMTAPGQRSASASVTTSTVTPSRTNSVSRSVSTVKKQPSSSTLSTTQNLQNTPKARPLSTSKSLATRTPKPKPSLGNVFGQAISPPGTAVASPNRDTPVKKTPDTVRRVPSSSVALRDHIAKAKAAKKPDVTESPPKPASSSNALREQIAKARAAAKQAKTEPVRNNTPPTDVIVPDPAEIATFDFGLEDDPFNQNPKGGKSVLRRRIDSARSDGRLNIAAMGLKEIPDDVLSMYIYDPNDTKVAWGEVVDLSTILAADNELEILPDSMFPDVTVEDMVDSDEAGPQFGGVQNLDFHGNLLRELPVGMRRLTQLSKLNLSRNKLSMDMLDVIAQIPTLRELKLGENDLQGDLSPALCNLTGLEVLELQSNKLTSIPIDIERMAQLRTLNVSDNQLRSIPRQVFSSTLIELHASKNRLGGTLFSIDSVSALQELHVAQNSLTSLCDGDAMDLPALKVLNVSTNRLTSLPTVSTWVSLITLLVGENKLSALPEGFVTLHQLRTADFTGNDITQLDEKIALMESLDHLTVAANPLRDRKFLTMGTDEMKRDLAARLPADEALANIDEDLDNAVEETQTQWQLTPSGTLDLADKDMSELEIDDATLEVFAEGLRQLHLQRNKFEAIPSIVVKFDHLTLLDLSRNNIEVALSAPLDLPQLRDLRLASNKITSLTPLTTYLTAPNLVTLDVSINRLSGILPILHVSFPSLTTLLASDNKISEVSVDSLTNLRIVNLGNNDIERLEPRIGLLQGTLTGLEVEGNKFRVPNRQVLQKGTDAVLTWLKDKIPRESWKSADSAGTEFFDANDGSF